MKEEKEEKIVKEEEKIVKEEEKIVKEEESSDASISESEAEKGFKMIKNPDVDTSFLPDRDREDAENRLREELRQVRGNTENG